MLLDVILNPTKHNAGDSAESAKSAVEKVFAKADVDVKKIRQELEDHMSKQPKLSGTSPEQQKTMGTDMVKVLEQARNSQTMLGVS